MNKDATFDDISIMGRVIYIIYAIDVYLSENDDRERWDILLKALWSFPEFDKHIDDYAYKVIECTPECVLDEQADYAAFDYFSQEDLCMFRELYVSSAYTKTIDNLLGQINEILSYNLYTSVKPPETVSLEIINATYLYIKEILGKRTPSIEAFKIYSIHEHTCWGDFTLGKEVLLAHMNE